MLETAKLEFFGADTRVKINKIEVENGPALPTATLLQRLQAQNPETEVWFLMGSDLIPDMHTWEEFEFMKK